MFLRSFRSALSSISPLVFLGFACIISTLGVDYQVLFFLCTNYVHYYLLIPSFIIIATACTDMEPVSCRYAIHATFCHLFPQWPILHDAHFLFLWTLKLYNTERDWIYYTTSCFLLVILKVKWLDIKSPGAMEKLFNDSMFECCILKIILCSLSCRFM